MSFLSPRSQEKVNNNYLHILRLEDREKRLQRRSLGLATVSGIISLVSPSNHYLQFINLWLCLNFCHISAMDMFQLINH